MLPRVSARTSLLLLPLALLGMSGCDQQPTGPGVTTAGLISVAENSDGTTAAMTIRQDAIIEVIGEVPGAIHSATLRRNKNNAQLRMTVSAPAPNTATVWAVVFNDPTKCAAYPEQPSCGLGDLDTELVMASIVRVGGRVIGGEGPTTITGHVREGDGSELIFGSTPLVDAMTAEIHFIFRLHGVPISGMVDDQIHSVGGGCAINTCGDVAAAIFSSP